MSLSEQIDAELKRSMKARAAARTSVLRSLKAALRNAAIDKGGADYQLSDDEALAVVRKQAKQREDSIASYRQGGREDLAASERAELEIIGEFLPAALGADELKQLVSAAISETGAKDRSQMGAVMKLLQQRAAGRADGRALSAEVQRQLG